MLDPEPSAEITLLLPDGQEIGRVRLYERQQLGSGLWLYRIHVPLWQTAVGSGVEPADYETWVTAAQLRPIPGVSLDGIPSSRAVQGRWAWLLDGRSPGRPTTVHAQGCRLANGNARPLATMAALDALAGPGAVACTGCDAAEVLVPILRHGTGEAR